MRRLLFLLVAAATPVSAQAFDAATGYRVADYRGVVPAPPPGVARIDAGHVAALAGTAILVDVAPAEGGVRGPGGRWRLAAEHGGIAGAAWFPEAGRGRIDPAIESWFLSGVRRLRAARPRAPIVVFCLADCWMSWNASLRLRRAGFRDVRWFAEGSDGWRELGRALTPQRPYKDRP